VTRFDIAEHLQSEEQMAGYLQACFEEANADAGVIAAAIGHVAKSVNGKEGGLATLELSRGSPRTRVVASRTHVNASLHPASTHYANMLAPKFA
jgi:hypothetical protein